jgi:hypothetical protein
MLQRLASLLPPLLLLQGPLKPRLLLLGQQQLLEQQMLQGWVLLQWQVLLQQLLLPTVDCLPPLGSVPLQLGQLADSCWVQPDQPLLAAPCPQPLLAAPCPQPLLSRLCNPGWGPEVPLGWWLYLQRRLRHCHVEACCPHPYADV